jgi:hypothetical protein
MSTVACGTCGGSGFIPAPGCTCTGPAHNASAGCYPRPCPNPACVGGQVSR